MTLTVKDMPDSLRPREKALNMGFESLSDSELLALILRNGISGCSSIELANQILTGCNGITGLLSMSLEQIMSLKGIKLAKATQILASVELVRRLNYSRMLESDVINNPRHLINWLQKTYGNRDQEYFIAVFLDTRYRVKGYKEIFIGTDQMIKIQAREIFNEALKRKSNRMIIAHNHPSQVADPSNADCEMTQALILAGQLMNIPVIDHIIISYDSYYSFREKGRI
ncbi:MAG: DNA repair protein RadC [Erysipelotrichaceae bacterium]|nr:DNA repair protein RadC [Erysipelotrichaceae bacterium]